MKTYIQKCSRQDAGLAKVKLSIPSVKFLIFLLEILSESRDRLSDSFKQCRGCDFNGMRVAVDIADRLRRPSLCLIQSRLSLPATSTEN
jgi:hypothetical protein